MPGHAANSTPRATPRPSRCRTRTTSRPRTCRTRGRSGTSTTTTCATSAVTTTCSPRSTSARTTPASTPRARITRSRCASSTTAPTSTTAPRRAGRTRDGRTWVTGMGHFGVRYTENGGDTNLVKMIVGGIRWVAGEGRKTDCSGTVWSNFHRTVLVADANQPIGIDVAKDGKVYWSEMGQPGTAANQYNSQGAIMMHDQKGAGRQQDHRRHDPDARGSRQLRGRRAGHVPAAGLRPRRSDQAQRVRVLLAAPRPERQLAVVATPAAPGRGLQPDQPLHAHRGRHVGRAGLRARDPARPQGQDRRLAVRLPGRSDGLRPGPRGWRRPGLRLRRQHVPRRR